MNEALILNTNMFCQQTIFTADILTVIVGKAQVLLITLMMASHYSSIPMSHDSLQMTQHEHQVPESEAAK